MKKDKLQQVPIPFRYAHLMTQSFMYKKLEMNSKPLVVGRLNKGLLELRVTCPKRLIELNRNTLELVVKVIKIR